MSLALLYVLYLYPDSVTVVKHQTVNFHPMCKERRNKDEQARRLTPTVRSILRIGHSRIIPIYPWLSSELSANIGRSPDRCRGKRPLLCHLKAFVLDRGYKLPPEELRLSIKQCQTTIHDRNGCSFLLEVHFCRKDIDP